MGDGTKAPEGTGRWGLATAPPLRALPRTLRNPAVTPGRAACCVNGCENRRRARCGRKRRDFALAAAELSAPVPPPWPPRGRRGSSGPPPPPPAAGSSPPPRRQPGRGRAAAALPQPGGQRGRSACLPGRCSGKRVMAVRSERAPRRAFPEEPGRVSALRAAGASGCLWHGPARGDLPAVPLTVPAPPPLSGCLAVAPKRSRGPSTELCPAGLCPRCGLAPARPRTGPGVGEARGRCDLEPR